jgi:hypothetical protein
MIPATEIAGFKDVHYPPRFATLEAAQRAVLGDFSGSERPFELKDYGPPVGGVAVLREPYKNAPYEMRYISLKP